MRMYYYIDPLVSVVTTNNRLNQKRKQSLNMEGTTSNYVRKQSLKSSYSDGGKNIFVSFSMIGVQFYY